MPLYVQLPTNLCSELKHVGKSVYYRDYCVPQTSKKARPKRRSYTTLIKSASDSKFPLSDHYNTLPYGYSYDSFNGTVNDINGKMKDANLKSFKRIIYGVAGKKIDIKHKKSKSENDKNTLPGLEKWLETANEYEKEVVHKFVSTLAKEESKPKSPKASQMNDTERPSSTNLRPATQNSVRSTRSDSDLPRPKSTNSIITLHPNVEIKKSVRIRSAPVSSLSNRKSTPAEKNRRAMTKDRWTPQVDSFQKEDPRIPSPASSRASSAASLDRGNISTQIPYQYGSKPSSPLYKNNLSKSTPDLSHQCKQCAPCRKKELKELLKEMAK